MTRNPFRAQPDNRRTSTSHPFSQTSRTTAPRDGPGSPFFSRHRASTGSLPTSDSTPRQRSGETGQPASSAGSVRYLADDILGLNRWLSTLSTQNTAETPSRSDSVGGLYPIPSPALNTSSRPNPSRTATIPQQSRPDTLRTGSRARCKIVIGIDFGTTFSGVAYAVVQPNEAIEDVRINTVSNWEGRLPGRTTSNKVPTEIAFDQTDGDKHYWGFDIPDDLSERKVKYVKLLLEPNVCRRVSSVSGIINPESTSELLRSLHRSPVDVAGLFVRSLWEHAKAQIIRHKGQATWNFAEKVVLFTVPAVWSERAKHNTYMVAVNAGLASDDISLHMVSEPEAAAVAVLKDRVRTQTLINGDVFVIVDAGGGTVDLTSYRIKSVEPLELEEVVVGDGDVCGATFLEFNFQELIRARIGVNQLRELDALTKERMICDWEDSIRAIYTGEDDRRYVLITPGVSNNASSAIRSGMMTLTADDLKPVFLPIVNRIERLVHKQLRLLAREQLRPTAIILVGGLGSNRYLAKQLKQRYDSSGSPGHEIPIEIQQPDIAWESVAHGAVRCEILGYSSTVSMRVARYNIGWLISLPWDDNRGFRPEQKYRHEYDGAFRANNCVEWMLRRGQKLTRDDLFEETLQVTKWEGDLEQALLQRDKAVWQSFEFVADQEENASVIASLNTRTFMSVSVRIDLVRYPPSRMVQGHSPAGRPYRSTTWTLCARQNMAGITVSIKAFGEVLQDDVRVDFYSLPERVDGGRNLMVSEHRIEGSSV